MNCACGALLPPYAGRGRPRVRCATCAAKSKSAKAWRAANSGRVDAYNAARRADYAARSSVERARARLRYALRVRRRVDQAKRELEQAMAHAA